MAEILLTQSEADVLRDLPKYKINNEVWTYPDLGGSINIPLLSKNGREEFILDISRGRVNLKKGTLQNRTHQTIILARLDYEGAGHRNPDGEEIPSPHLHIYREGYGDKWAIPIPADQFTNILEPWQSLIDFMKFCKIVDQPNINRGLFT